MAQLGKLNLTIFGTISCWAKRSSFANPSSATRDSGLVTGEIYIGYVDSLLVEINGLIIASAATILAAIVAAVSADCFSLWICVGIFVFIALLRLYFMVLHSKNRPSKNVEDARWREDIFIVGAVAHMGMLSLWTLVAFVATPDVFSRFISITFTLPYAFGMWTRSYALNRGMNAQMIVAFIPISIALIFAGGWYQSLIVTSIVPLILFVKSASRRLRNAFLAEIRARNQSMLLAERLDTALNNMSHGLCMIDGQGRLTLANQQFLTLLGLPGGASLSGAHWRVIIRKLIKAGRLGQSTVSALTNAGLRRARDGDFVVPIETRDGRAIEAVVHHMTNDGTVLVIQDVTDRRNAEIKINRMAHFDVVTELPNRHSFEIALTRALDADSPHFCSLTVMFLDLDNFKQVNDSLGHRTGDKLLMEIARRLLAIAGPRDLVARWGGDEFVILHYGGENDAATPELARRIIDEIGKPVVIDGSEVIVGASIGTASAPEDGLSADALLSNADIALYAAKADGRRGWRAFEPAMDTRIQVRRLVEMELRAAVATEAIEVYFQPIFNAATRKIVSFEALARWRHPARGLVSPGEFIPILEDIGLMEDFGAAVLTRACAACAAWPENVSVSVNLSSSQFRSGKIESVIARTLKVAGLSPNRLDLEITESTLLEDRGDTRGALAMLRARGCRISLDDFGTGYSSLSYLLSFPLDRIKIDRSFTLGLGVQERASILVESVATMSRKLGMSVLIEGVETERQMKVIQQLGTISEVQGFLFSPPVPLEQVAELLRRDRDRAAA